MALFTRRRKVRGLRLFFCTDVHGSEQCFRKFLNAASFYGVDHLVLGGDMLGKLLIPIVQNGNGTYYCNYGDQRYHDLAESEIQAVKDEIRRFGHYPIVGSAELLQELENDQARERVFRKIAYDSVADWVALAESRLRGTGVRCFMAPGNDDFLEIDGALQGSDVVEFAEGKRLALADGHEMITTGYSNPTPWDTERELTEDALADLLSNMMTSVERPESLIAVIHPPPYDTEIDSAPALDGSLQMKMDAGGVRMAPVGSTAVRAFIEQVQPLLGLHGHVHESRGVARIGRTTCINPGSEYTDGVLSGSILELASTEVISHQFVAG
jgi:Icc-related predicted phosphoesterase